MPIATLAFGPFVLEPGRRLLRDGTPVALGQHGLALLEALIEADGELVDRARLIKRAWPGMVVEDGNLSVQIATLRRVLGKTEQGSPWIVTVPRGGYRLAAGGERPDSPRRTSRPSLAVLPFDNLSGDRDQDYLADGLTEDIITALSRFRAIGVAARNSSFIYKGRAVDVRQVGKDLAVGYVLEGSVRRAGNRLRVTAQLVDARSGLHLWARNFDSGFEEVFDVQDEIVACVASSIEPQIHDAEIARSRLKRPESLDAYELWLRALPKYHSGRQDDNAEAYVLLARAIELDPHYARALNTASQTLGQRHGMGWSLLTKDDKAICIDLCWRAIEQAPDDAMLLSGCALTLISVGRQYESGMEVMANALKANPASVIVHINAGIAELHCGSVEKSLTHSHRAIAMMRTGDFNAQYPMTAVAHAQMVLGNWDEARRFAERSLAVNPIFNATHWMLVAANAQLGHMDEARRRLAIFRERSPSVTIASIRGGQPARFPDRMAAILDGLRLAGLPES